ncbi:MAG: hypothetical protein ACE5NP_06310 [Anaerolineae bacterium]
MSAQTSLLILGAMLIFIVSGAVYVNFRNLRHLKILIQNLRISTNIPRYWGGVLGGFRTVQGTYDGHEVLLGTEGDEEDIVLRIRFTTPCEASFYVTSDTRIWERVISQPLFKKWHEYHVPEAEKAYQTIRYTAKRESIPTIRSSGLLERLSELVNVLAPYEGHFYINEWEVKMKFPSEAKLEEDVLEAGCQVGDFICSLPLVGERSNKDG